MKAMVTILLGGLAAPATFAQQAYQYDRHTRASDYARDFFGKPDGYQRVPEIDVGQFSAGVSTQLDCGKVDINANMGGELRKIQDQVSALLPHDAKDAIGLAERGGMMAVCYAYPSVCAQLRHDFLALQANLNLRAQACKAIDQYIDSSAEKGAKQLRAEAQAECIGEKAKSMTMTDATRECQSTSGLPLRDFQAGMEKKFTTSKQKVLAAIVDFAQDKDPPTYDFLASMIGEIEVQPDGYWQPLWAKGMLRPSDMAGNFLAAAEAKACGTKLAELIARRRPSSASLVDNSIDEVIARRLSTDDVQNLADLNDEDRQLACAALGRALGQVAARSASAKAEAALASGLLNTAIPNSLRDEFRTRGGAAFDALKKAVESDQIPPVEDVRGAIGQLARATREKNRAIAAKISAGKLQNYRQDSESKSDCTDTLSCGGN